MKNGVTKDLTFYHDGFKKKTPMRNSNIDNNKSIHTSYPVTTSLINRLMSRKCEMCGTTGTLMMHHVRKLKDLKGENPLEMRMISRKRKTIALCDNCLVTAHHR